MRLTRTSILIISVSAVVVVSVILSLIFSAWWLLLIFMPVFALPILRGEGIFRDSDEFKRINRYRSSHLAFYVTLFLILVVVIGKGLLKGEPVDTALFLVIIVAVLAKEGSNLILHRPLHQAGIIIGSMVGGLWLLAAMFSYGFTVQGLIESSFGVAILLATGVALFRPWMGGALLIIGACLSLVWYVLPVHDTAAVVLLLVMRTLPLLLAGLLVLSSAWGGSEQAEKIK